MWPGASLPRRAVGLFACLSRRHAAQEEGGGGGEAHPGPLLVAPQDRCAFLAAHSPRCRATTPLAPLLRGDATALSQCSALSCAPWLRLQTGICGMPNVGKSTLFNVLTKCTIPAENFPFCTIDPNNVRSRRAASRRPPGGPQQQAARPRAAALRSCVAPARRRHALRPAARAAGTRDEHSIAGRRGSRRTRAPGVATSRRSGADATRRCALPCAGACVHPGRALRLAVQQLQAEEQGSGVSGGACCGVLHAHRLRSRRVRACCAAHTPRRSRARATRRWWTSLAWSRAPPPAKASVRRPHERLTCRYRLADAAARRQRFPVAHPRRGRHLPRAPPRSAARTARPADAFTACSGDARLRRR